MNESPAHDAHVLDGLVAATERSLGALGGEARLPDAVRDHVAARRAAVDALRAVGASRPPAEGDGLLDKAQRVLERFVGDAPAAPASPPPSQGAGGLDALEREEQALQARFEAALADDRLSGPVRDAVLRAYDQVKPGHDAVRQAALAARGEA